MRPLSIVGILLSASALCFPGRVAAAADVPEDYKLVYEQDFEQAAALNDFRYSDPRAWRIGEMKGSHALELHGRSDYQPTHRSPANLAMMFTTEFENFVLEADMLQTGREYGHRDMCIYFGFVDPAKYYYAHVATKTDPHAHNIMIVNDAPRIKISTMTTDGVDWGQEQWHKVRLVRDISKGTIEVYYDDMSKPIMTAEDKTFPKGYVGFGSFDDTGMIDNVKIWAPQSSDKRAHNLFAAKPLKPIDKEPDVKGDGFKSIFDGRTLDGWRRADGKASGKMEYTVNDGAIVGTCVPKEPNGFLCTEKTYRDFVFTCEAKFDVLGNSGIQFRSNQREDNGRVYGYQCEIDHSDRRYSGGLYDEARRAWLFPLWGAAYADARAAFKEGEWNRFTIKAEGRRLQTWVNGVPCTDYTDTDPEHFTPEGFIALQVHGGPQGQIRWRNLRLKELEPKEKEPPRRETYVPRVYPVDERGFSPVDKALAKAFAREETIADDDEGSLNPYVMRIIAAYPLDGSYPYHCSWTPREYDIYNGVTQDMWFQGQVVAKAYPDGSRCSYCCGFTFEVFIRAMKLRNVQKGLDPDDFNGMTFHDLFNMLQLWYIEGKGDCTQRAIVSYGLGRPITDLEDARPGDFGDYSTTPAGGHAIIFIDWIRNDEKKIVGLKYFSSNLSGTRGVGYGKAMFSDSTESGKGVLRNYLRLARVGSIDSYKPFNRLDIPQRNAYAPTQPQRYLTEPVPLAPVTTSAER